VAAVASPVAIAWGGSTHRSVRDPVASVEIRAAAQPCNELATLRDNVEQQVRDACEGLPNSAKVTVTQTFTGCFGNTINDGTVTVESGAVICGNLRFR